MDASWAQLMVVAWKCLDGERAGAPLPLGLATGPPWPICAEIAAPSACTASVSTRSPGIASSVQWIWCRSVRPSFDTAQ